MNRPVIGWGVATGALTGMGTALLVFRPWGYAAPIALAFVVAALAVGMLFLSRTLVREAAEVAPLDALASGPRLGRGEVD